MLGGDGDDNLRGDFVITTATRDWQAVRQIDHSGGVARYGLGFRSLTSEESAAGADLMFGGDGDDWLFAGAGDDLLDSGAGDDIAAGEAGNDQIDGGAGADILSGRPPR